MVCAAKNYGGRINIKLSFLGKQTNKQKKNNKQQLAIFKPWL